MNRILIVEDEALERNFLQSIVEENASDGTAVWSCATGTSAVELAKKHSPDTIFLDIMIPEKDGITALKEIRQFLPKAAVIILSAFSDFSYAQQAIDLNVCKYLLKPVKPREIIKILKHTEEQKELSDSVNAAADIAEEKEPLNFVKEAVKFIHNNYHDKLTLETVSAHVYINPQYFSRVFKKELGVSFIDYVNNLRIQKACMLLETSDFPSYRISNECGFNDPSYFNRVFYKQMQTTPNKYRRSVRVQKAIEQ